MVRLFAEILQVVLGGSSALESVGIGPSALVVIETDGAIRQFDALSAAYSGAADTGLNVREHPLDAALDHPGVVAQQLGRAGLSPLCQACSIGRLCGGGLYAHRYRAGSGFLHPSVYCPDLFRLISHIRDRVYSDVRGLRAAPQTKAPTELT